MSGVVHEEQKENFLTYVNNLKFANKLFEENDIIGLIEPINSYSLPGYYLNNFHKGL